MGISPEQKGATNGKQTKLDMKLNTSTVLIMESEYCIVYRNVYRTINTERECREMTSIFIQWDYGDSNVGTHPYDLFRMVHNVYLICFYISCAPI